jgi:hypothetical protein
MKVRKIGLGIVLAGFTLASAAPAIAQSDPRGGGGPPGGGASERSGGGGASTSAGSNAGGGSVATGGGGGGGGSVSSGSSSSGGGFNSPSVGAASGNFSSIDRGTRATAPERRAGFSASSSGQSDGQKASPRTAAGSGSGERAVPRGSSGASSSGSGNSGGGNATSGRTRTQPDAASNGNNSSGTREVPQWSRPRGDRPATGVAVDRVGPPPDRDRDHYRGRYYDPYYYGGGYGYGFNYGGYYGYSPYYYPYGFGMGYGLYSGLGWNPYYGDPMDSYYGGGGGYSSGTYNTRDQGNLKLKVKPRTAKVYVDGYFVGTVDQFDGAFQKLALNGGRHKVEVRADGFETAEFDVLITPSQTITFQGELKRIQ